MLMEVGLRWDCAHIGGLFGQMGGTSLVGLACALFLGDITHTLGFVTWGLFSGFWKWMLGGKFWVFCGLFNWHEYYIVVTIREVHFLGFLHHHLLLGPRTEHILHPFLPRASTQHYGPNLFLLKPGRIFDDFIFISRTDHNIFSLFTTTLLLMLYNFFVIIQR